MLGLTLGQKYKPCKVLCEAVMARVMHCPIASNSGYSVVLTQVLNVAVQGES